MTNEQHDRLRDLTTRFIAAGSRFEGSSIDVMLDSFEVLVDSLEMAEADEPV